GLLGTSRLRRNTGSIQPGDGPGRRDHLLRRGSTESTYPGSHAWPGFHLPEGENLVPSPEPARTRSSPFTPQVARWPDGREAGPWRLATCRSLLEALAKPPPPTAKMAPRASGIAPIGHLLPLFRPARPCPKSQTVPSNASCALFHQ